MAVTFSLSDVTGSSGNSCSNEYRGTAPFTEPCVKGVANLLKELNTANGLGAFLDFHSYSQLWLGPWGYTKDLPVDFDTQV